MKLMEEKQCLEWIERNFLKVTSISNFPIQEFRKKADYVRAFVVPFKPDYYLVIASKISEWLEYETALFCMDYCGGSDIGEHIVFQNIEERFGIGHSLIKSHNLYFEQKDDKNTIAIYDIIVCLLCFNWEGYLFSDAQRTLIWFADEIIEIHTTSKEQVYKIDKLLNILQIDAFN